jgi:hypothetical protein
MGDDTAEAIADIADGNVRQRNVRECNSGEAVTWTRR